MEAMKDVIVFDTLNIFIYKIIINQFNAPHNIEKPS